ncbi:hypothetical protein [Micromonospora schwarzwaldensis]|uniref:hypothetical protein n=1 Tax=Micromonospora sp. DSM 45708 TaxID=3111767 RepID=UPI0031DAFD50
MSATSILENSPSDDFGFVMLDLGLRPETRRRLTALIGRSRLTFLEPADEAAPAPGTVDAPLRISAMLAGAHDRVIHLDCDTLVVGDLSPLSSIDLEDFPVAGTPRLTEPGSDGPPALDPGVLVIDTRRFVEERSGRRDPLPPRWKRLGSEWRFPVLGRLHQEWTGPLPVVHHFDAPHDLVHMRVMYDEYRRQCIAAGGPTF